MLAKARTLTPSERVELQLGLAEAQMNVDSESAAITCAAIDAAPGGAPRQRQRAQLLLAQAWWQQISQMDGDSRRSAIEYREGLVQRVRTYASRLRESSSPEVANAATDLHLALETAFPIVDEEAEAEDAGAGETAVEGETEAVSEG